MHFHEIAVGCCAEGNRTPMAVVNQYLNGNCKESVIWHQMSTVFPLESKKRMYTYIQAWTFGHSPLQTAIKQIIFWTLWAYFTDIWPLTETLDVDQCLMCIEHIFRVR